MNVTLSQLTAFIFILLWFPVNTHMSLQQHQCRKAPGTADLHTAMKWLRAQHLRPKNSPKRPHMAGKQEHSGATWEPSETSTRQTHRAWLNTGCVQTQFCVCVCLFLGVLLKLILKLDSSCWLNHTDLTFDPSGGTFTDRCLSQTWLQIDGDRRWGSAHALLLYIF